MEGGEAGKRISGSVMHAWGHETEADPNRDSLFPPPPPPLPPAPFLQVPAPYREPGAGGKVSTKGPVGIASRSADVKALRTQVDPSQQLKVSVPCSSLTNATNPSFSNIFLFHTTNWPQWQSHRSALPFQEPGVVLASCTTLVARSCVCLLMHFLLPQETFQPSCNACTLH